MEIGNELIFSFLSTSNREMRESFKVLVFYGVITYKQPLVRGGPIRPFIAVPSFCPSRISVSFSSLFGPLPLVRRQTALCLLDSCVTPDSCRISMDFLARAP
jgi:hypothetical protein